MQLTIAGDCGLLPRERFATLVTEVVRVGRMISGQTINDPSID